MLKDVKPLFLWAKQRGDANIYDRIIIKIIPNLLKENIKITSQQIDNQEEILVSEEIYKLILETAQSLVGQNLKEDL